MGEEDVIVVNVFSRICKSIELVFLLLQSSETEESGLGWHDVCTDEEDWESKVTDHMQRIDFTFSEKGGKGRVREKLWKLSI